MDLADLYTIRAFATKALDGGRPLDILINNAGKCMRMQKYFEPAPESAFRVTSK